MKQLSRTWFSGLTNVLFVMGSMCLRPTTIDACLAIVVCRIGLNFYAHLSQVPGHYKGDASGIWDSSRGSGAPEGTAYEIKPLTRIHRVSEALIGPDSPEGIAVFHRVAVMQYLLDIG